jgi:hypothetical protein
MSASKKNLPACANCQRALSELLHKEQMLRFCGQECTQEWSAKTIGAIAPDEVWALANQVRAYIEARQADRGVDVQFGVMVLLARRIWPSLTGPQVIKTVQAVADLHDMALDFP